MWPNKFSTKSEGREEKNPSQVQSHIVSFIFNQQLCLTLQFDGKGGGSGGLVHVGLAGPIEEQMKEKTKKNRKTAMLRLFY